MWILRGIRDRGRYLKLREGNRGELFIFF